MLIFLQAYNKFTTLSPYRLWLTPIRELSPLYILFALIYTLTILQLKL